jgi:PAS domain S-box-containing protein
MKIIKPPPETESVPYSPGLFKGIRFKILILLLIFVIPILAIQAGIYRSRFQDRRQLAMQGNLEIARSTAERFRFFLESTIRHESAAGKLLRSLPLPITAQIDLMKEIAAQNPPIQHMHWINPHGKIIVSSLPEAIGQNRQAETYFQDILSGKEWVLSNLYRSELTGTPVFSISRGIRDGKGTLAGVVTAVVDAEKLDGILKTEREGQGSIMLIDRQGRRAFHDPQIETPWEKGHLWTNPSLLKEALAGKEMISTIDNPLDRVRRIVTLTPIHPYGWVAGAGRPEAEVMTPIYSNLFRQMTFSLVAVLGSFLLALLFSRSITNPIRRLRDHALILGRGDLEQRIRISGPAELADLSRTMNRMAEELSRSREQADAYADQLLNQKEELRKANEQLETRVRERTAELIKVNKDLKEEADKRKARERAYKQLSHQFELILNTAEEGIFGIDPNGIITFANPAAAKLMGREIEDLLNQPIHELSRHSRFDGIPIPLEECGICRYCPDGTTQYATEEAFMRPNGAFFPVEYSRSPIWEEGKLEGAVVVFRDITERRTVLETLKRSEERLKYLSEELLSTQEKERRQIAKDLHDSIGSSLAAIKYKVESIVAAQGQDLSLVQLLTPVITWAKNAIKEVRRISQNLRPAVLDDLGLVVALSWFCREFETTFSIGVQIQTDIMENDVPEPLKIVIFRIMQEAMNNSAKYSQADQIIVRLLKRDDVIEMAVEDNGRGFEPDEAASRQGSQKGLGLISMRERAEFSGGSFNIESGPEKGTLIKASWTV